MTSRPRELLLADVMLGHMVVPQADLPSVSDNITVLDMRRDEIWRHVVASIVAKRPGTRELMMLPWPRDEESRDVVTTT
jgi:hypothetical protein